MSKANLINTEGCKRRLVSEEQRDASSIYETMLAGVHSLLNEIQEGLRIHQEAQKSDPTN